MSIEEYVEAQNRRQDLRLIQKLELDRGDLLDRGGLPIGGMNYTLPVEVVGSSLALLSMAVLH